MKSMPQDTFISRWPWFVTADIVETVSLGDCGRFSDVSQKCQRAKGNSSTDRSSASVRRRGAF
jgi:hypothetical protein